MIRRNFLKTVGAQSLAALYSGQPREAAPADDKAGRGGAGMDPWLEIDLEAVAWNLLRVKRHAKVPVMAVVKANAYGHGLIEVSKTLARSGADWLMVGKLREGLALREAGIACPILNFGPWAPQESVELVRSNVSQSVYTDDAGFLQEAAAKLDRTASVHLDVDTGMGRTGMPYERALPLIEKIASLSRVKIAGICTTLTEDPEFDREQIRRLLELCASAKRRGIALGLRHAASSAGILASPGQAGDHALRLLSQRPDAERKRARPEAGAEAQGPGDLRQGPGARRVLVLSARFQGPREDAGGDPRRRLFGRLSPGVRRQGLGPDKEQDVPDDQGRDRQPRHGRSG
jgi:hypothetical protein